MKTPLLVPSFSSKGFDVNRDHDRPAGFSEVSQYLSVFGPTLTETFLISGYDIHHELLQESKRLTSPPHFPNSVWNSPELLFVDSGLYEFRVGADSEEPVQEMRLPQDWTETDFCAFAARLPRKAPIALVNWDRHGPYAEQIAAAQEFFADHTAFLRVCLLKPEREGGFHDIARLGAEASRLAAFDIVGVTEKELGDSVLDRMGTVAKLHDLLAREEVEAPIHVFGALDPLFTPLYYAAGAEIFDGLSWLRYFWQDGVALHRASLSVLMSVPDRGHQLAIEMAQSQNLDKIRTLQRRLVNFYKLGEDWSVFNERKEVLEDAFRDMESTL
jgi:hypothetical protein